MSLLQQLYRLARRLQPGVEPAARGGLAPLLAGLGLRRIYTLPPAEQGSWHEEVAEYCRGRGGPRQLRRRMGQLGLPGYEGYGLSEAASVVAVNRPGDTRPGTVGRPLPHVRLRFAADGEIEVGGSLFSGYLGDGEEKPGRFWPTGDIGHLDDEGFLHLTGRKKHIFITAFGRNIAPEWVERELTVTGAIAQAVVYGEARPFNVAVLVPRMAADAAVIAQTVAQANARLPDYARIRRWLLADAPFSLANGQWTGTGRPRRQAIWKAYAERIRAMYAEEELHGVL